MVEKVKKLPPIVQIVAILFSVFLSSIGFSVAYGSLNKQVDINTDDIGYIKVNMVDKDSMVTIQNTLTIMQEDIKKILANN